MTEVADRHWRTSAVAAAAAVLCLGAASAPPHPLPFHISSQRGSCANCRTAQGIEEVRLHDGRAVWGLGYNPPGEIGAGDWTILRSGDGGRSWRELPWSYEHNDAPLLSFAAAWDGWTKVFDMSHAESAIRVTNDGGLHWRRLPFRNLFVGAIQYVGHGVGLFSTFSPYDPHAYLYATANNGRSWRKTELPRRFDLQALAFVNVTKGFIAGCRDGNLTVFRTDDGGRGWKATDLEKRPAGTDGCPIEADALRLFPDGNAWLLAQKHSFRIGDATSFSSIWKSSSDGREWKRVFVASVTSKANGDVLMLDGPYPLGSRTVVVFRLDRPTLLYSQDAGASWNEARLPHTLFGCYPAKGKLTCAGGAGSAFGLAVLTPR
jgi:photosystem II stability/assembly factor-like uncharacterized protein